MDSLQNPPVIGLTAGKSSQPKPWQMALVFVVVFVSLAWKLQPPKRDYVAVGTFMRPQVAAAGSAPASDRGVNTIVALLTNPALILRAADKLTPALRQAGWASEPEISTAVLARSPDSQSLIEVTVRAAEAKPASALVEALMAAYTAQLNENARTERRQALQAAQEKVRQIEGMLRKTAPAEQDAERRLSLLQQQIAARDRVLALSLSDLDTATGPTLITLRVMPNPVARTWSRTLITSFVCALLLTALVAIGLDQLRPRPD